MEIAVNFEDRQFLALESRISDLISLSEQFQKEHGTSSSLALEAERLMPQAGILNLHFSAADKAHKYKVALESANVGMWLAIAAVIALIVGVFRKIYKSFFNNDNNDKTREFINKVNRETEEAMRRTYKVFEETFNVSPERETRASLDDLAKKYIQTPEGKDSAIAKMIRCENIFFKSFNLYESAASAVAKTLKKEVQHLHQLAGHLKDIDVVVSGSEEDKHKKNKAAWEAVIGITSKLKLENYDISMMINIAEKENPQLNMRYTQTVNFIIDFKSDNAAAFLDVFDDMEKPFGEVQKELERIENEIKKATANSKNDENNIIVSGSAKVVNEVIKLVREYMRVLVKMMSESKRYVNEYMALQRMISKSFSELKHIVEKEFKDHNSEDYKETMRQVRELTKVATIDV